MKGEASDITPWRAAPGPSCAVVLGVVTLWGAGCGEVAAEGAPRPPIVFVALDSVPARATALGGAESATPLLDHFAAEALSFEACLASEPWTAPTVAAALHGAPIDLATDVTAANTAPALPEVLQRAGYRTHAVVAHDCLGDHGDESLLFRGFDEIERLGVDDPAGALAHDVVAAGLRVLAEADGRPPFLLLHFADARPPHHEYSDPGTGAAVELPRPYDGPVRAGLAHEELLRIASELGPHDFAHLRYLAATEIAAADAALGELFDGLARLTLAREAVVVVFGTRGAWLGEGGRVGLRPGLEPEVLHVPLAVHVPARVRPESEELPAQRAEAAYRGRSRALASTMDVAPTIYDLLELREPAGVVGRSLLPDAGARGVEGRRNLRVSTTRAHAMAAVYTPGAGWVRSLETGAEHTSPWLLGASPGAVDAARLADEAAASAGLAIEMDRWQGPREGTSR